MEAVVLGLDGLPPAHAPLDATRGIRARFLLDGIVGRSVALAEALKQAMLAAPLDVHVLLTGESGTGKSQLARAIHLNSGRRAGPFVELNCAALPAPLLESELFGALKGSHSEAHRDLPGKVEAASGGTLLLDEIGDLAYEAQAKLLHLLHAREFYPLGATRPRRADIRLIAATNVELEHAVAERRFRQDLYYRLQVLPIRLPSLAERREDVAPLAESLLERIAQRHGLRPRRLSRAALRAVADARWPGNVRQLEHVLEAAAVRACGDANEEIGVRDLFPDRPVPLESEDKDLTFQEATRRFQRSFLEGELEATGWNVAKTARRLDLARSHVYNLISAFHLVRPGSATPIELRPRAPGGAVPLAERS